MMIRISAPGKVYLIGEHAVVYGKPGVIASVGLRTNVEVKKSDKVIFNSKTFSFSDSWSVDDTISCATRAMELWKKCYEKKNFDEMFDYIKTNHYGIYKKATVGIVLNKLGIRNGVDITVETEMPAGAGLGSSAAYAVAVTKAVAELYGRKITKEKINEIAYELEKIVHGTPSGGDNAACCYGGLILFKKEPLTIKSLKEEIPYELKNVVLVYTKEPEKTTGELVQGVRELDEGYRNKIIDELGELTEEMIKVLKEKNFERMKEIINQAQKNLAEIGVSCKEIDELHEKIKSIGGASKLCGAGGGGIMLCYHEDIDKLKELIKQAGYEVIEAALAVEGVKKEI